MAYPVPCFGEPATLLVLRRDNEGLPLKKATLAQISEILLQKLFHGNKALFTETKPNNEVAAAIATYIGIPVVVLLVIAWLTSKIWPYISPPLKAVLGWIAIRIAARIQWPLHYLIRTDAEKAWGTISGLVLPDIRLSLSRIFIPLSVRCLADNGTAEITELVASSKRPIIIIGGAGSGKTTLAKQIVLLNYSKIRNRQKKMLAVVVKLREMAASGHGVPEAIAFAFAVLRGDSKPNGAIQKIVDGAMRSGDLLLVLDGLDEVPDTASAPALSRKDVKDRISLYEKFRAEGSQLIITCRESSYRPGELDDVTTNVVEVQQFTADQVHEFLERWPAFKGHSVRGLKDELRRYPAILDVCRNPLLLTILAETYLQMISAGNRFSLPQSRREFYEGAIKELLERRPRKRRQDEAALTHLQKRDILEKVARDRFSTDSENRENISRQALIAIAKIYLPDWPPEKIVGELVNENAILTPIYNYSRDEVYIFAHRTFLEYLAAWYLLRKDTANELIKWYGKKEDRFDLIRAYCTISERTSEIEFIVSFFASDETQEGLLKAADCLVAARSIENTNLLASVAKRLVSLHTEIADVIVHKRSSEMLATLAKRVESAYMPARVEYNRLVKMLLSKITQEKTETNSVEAFKTAARANFIEVRKIVPELLECADLHLGCAVMQILAEQALQSEENDSLCHWCIDQLIKQVNKPLGDPLRQEAALQLCTLLSNRGATIRNLQNELPYADTDLTIWPLSSFFPNRVARLLIDTLSSVSPEKIPDRVIATAVRVRALNFQGEKKNVNINAWRNIKRDYIIGRLLKGASLAFAGALMIMSLLFGVLVSWVSVISAHDPVLFDYKDEHGLVENLRTVENQAKIIETNLKNVLTNLDSELSRLSKDETIWRFPLGSIAADNLAIVDDLVTAQNARSYALKAREVRARVQSAYPQFEKLSAMESILAGAIIEPPQESAYAVCREVGIPEDQIDILKAALASVRAPNEESISERLITLPPPVFVGWNRVGLFMVLFVSSLIPAVVIVLLIQHARGTIAEKPDKEGDALASLLAYSLAPAGVFIPLMGPWMPGVLPAMALIVGFGGAILIWPRQMHWNRFVPLVENVQKWTTSRGNSKK